MFAEFGCFERKIRHAGPSDPSPWQWAIPAVRWDGGSGLLCAAWGHQQEYGERPCSRPDGRHRQTGYYQQRTWGEVHTSFYGLFEVGGFICHLALAHCFITKSILFFECPTISLIISYSLWQVLHEGGQGSSSGAKYSVAVQRSAHPLQKGICSQALLCGEGS